MSDVSITDAIRVINHIMSESWGLCMQRYGPITGTIAFVMVVMPAIYLIILLDLIEYCILEATGGKLNE